MAVSISIPLFMKPADEIPGSGDFVTEAQLGELAGELHARLMKAASIVGNLHAAGLENSLCMYDVEYWTDWATPAQAEQQLRKLGIDPADVSLQQFDENGDYVDGQEDDDELLRDMAPPRRQQHAI
jgi:hypothetical protein